MLNFAGKEYEKSDRKIKTLGELRNVESVEYSSLGAEGMLEVLLM